ncbi:translocon subunit [Exophiala xenobiotica]|nr:translocon subunit [Exophiala xenobiotica]KAK5231779.1 translocon subunit [Exophiala xenobiotica]KAK5248939.1 translocon subunit [Exophiala xenobiotica]KAK5348191.1 translocon subunit [Exophiala xenobiotica]KAK5362689.1 translocon subunit [Exophiala xenobiotica]
MGFKTCFKKLGKASTPLKVAVAVAATKNGTTGDEDKRLPSSLRLGHGISTIQRPRFNDVARAQIVPPRTGASTSRGVRAEWVFTHLAKQGKSKASAQDILRRVAHAEFAKHSTVSAIVTQAETPPQPDDGQVGETNNTTEASEEPCLALVHVPRSPLLPLDSQTVAGVIDLDDILPNPIIEYVLEESEMDSADDSDLVSIIDLYFDQLPSDNQQVAVTSGGVVEAEEVSEEEEDSDSDEGVRLQDLIQDDDIPQPDEEEDNLREVVEVSEHHEADDTEANAQNENDDDDDTSLSHGAGHDTNSSRIPSTSTAATSEGAHVAAAHPRAPYIEAKHNEEVQQLTDSLQHQQSVAQDLRLQVLEREEQVETLQQVLKATQDERNRYEADQDDSDAQMQTLKQQLVLKDREIAQEKARTDAALQEIQHLQHNPLVVGDQQLIFERDQALAHIQHFANQAQQYQAIACAAGEARANLEEHVQQMQQTEACWQQDFAVLEERMEQADDAISGLEQQNNHLVQLKDQAEGKVSDLRCRVEALTRDITAAYVEDPTPAFTPMTVQPNELRDLQQAFEMSQQKCAELVETCRDMDEQIRQKDSESADLSAMLILERRNRVRLFTSLQKWQGKIENWRETIPGMTRNLALLESDPDLVELLESSKVHEENVRQEIESLSSCNYSLEIQILDMKQQHARESEVLSKRMEELQEENIRVDAENANLDILEDKIKDLQHQITNLKDEADSWKQQCLHEKYGDTAVVIGNLMKTELDRHTHEKEALYQRLCQYDAKFTLLNFDLSCIRGWVEDKMSGIRYMEAERDWYHAQVIALRERFASDLRAQPLDIPWNPNFSSLTSDQERQQLSLEDAIIAKVIGYNLGRADDWAKAEQKAATEKCPHGITALEIWTDIATEVNGAACQEATPEARPVEGKGKGKTSDMWDSQGNSIFF